MLPALLAISSKTALSTADKLAVTVPAALTNNSPEALHFAVLVVEFPESWRDKLTLCRLVDSARFTVGATIVRVLSSTCKNPLASHFAVLVVEFETSCKDKLTLCKIVDSLC